MYQQSDCQSVSVACDSCAIISKVSPFLPFKNLSGLNSVGFSHTFGSLPISATIKLTMLFFGTKKPSNSASFVTAYGTRKWLGGCRLKPSKTMAFR
ncbi:hypothetical protein QQP08_017364 [Theobroma cacao]|nr:hypothetical protein QQP08_016672 [Theobroma cacao]WRX24877.1 hypothetical protein QQP08_017364 [Theobroma cacao]